MAKKDYILLFRGGMPKKKDRDSNMKKWMTWMNKLIKQNIFVRGEPFEEKGKVIIGYEKQVKDYNSASTSIAGYAIINTTSLTAATKIAKDCPIFKDNGEVVVLGMEAM